LPACRFLAALKEKVKENPKGFSPVCRKIVMCREKNNIQGG
jgi:hypothetical protein